jgi:hypothetical protein
LINSAVYAQTNLEYLVFFDNKDPISKAEPSKIFSKEALEKRNSKHLTLKKHDLPVKKENLQSLNDPNVNILSHSKWLNACLIKTSYTAQQIKSLNTHIISIEPINHNPIPIKKSQNKFAKQQSLDYGANDIILDILNLKPLHDQGYTGENIKVAFIDGGFQSMDTSAITSDIVTNQVVDTWNFWTDSSDVYMLSTHGTYVSGYCAINQPEKYIGVSPDIDLYLYLTDHPDTETPSDEFFLVKALERADSLGVDIVNISLGYSAFDDPVNNYSFNKLDGQTAISTKGVNIAVDNGLLVITSAGNGNFVTAPGDAPNAITVGGTKTNKFYDAISSKGPLVNGQMKPDVASVTRNLPYVDLNTWETKTSLYSGTSSSSPQIAGLTACLMQRHSSASNVQLIQAIKESAHLYPDSSNKIGYGVPNAAKADSILSFMLSTKKPESPLELQVYPNPTTGTVFVNQKIKKVEVISLNGKSLATPSVSDNSKIELSNISEKVVLLKMELDSGKIVTKKLFIE